MKDEEDGTIVAPVCRDPRPIGADASNDAGGPQLSGPAREEVERTRSVLTSGELATLLPGNRRAVYGALPRRGIPGARFIGATYGMARGPVVKWLGAARVPHATTPPLARSSESHSELARHSGASASPPIGFNAGIGMALSRRRSARKNGASFPVGSPRGWRKDADPL